MRIASLPHLRRTLVIIGGLLGSVIAGTAGSVLLVRILSTGRRFSEAGVPIRTVGMVFGAQVYPNGRPSRFLAARLDLARRLYLDGKITVIIVSGDRSAPEYDEPRAMRDYLVASGVPQTKIITDGGGRDTYDSCHRLRHRFGVPAATLITQSYHLPRAVGTARALGIDAVGVGDDSVRNGPAWRRGVVRDQVACVKTVLDLLSRRDPSGGERSDDVRHARAT